MHWLTNRSTMLGLPATTSPHDPKRPDPDFKGTMPNVPQSCVYSAPSISATSTSAHPLSDSCRLMFSSLGFWRNFKVSNQNPFPICRPIVINGLYIISQTTFASCLIIACGFYNVLCWSIVVHRSRLNMSRYCYQMLNGLYIISHTALAWCKSPGCFNILINLYISSKNAIFADQPYPYIKHQ